MGTGLLEGSHTKSGVPIEHLDYRYVGDCKNAKELENILRVLRSGEEGFYPELIEFTEERLRKVDPKSKSLRKEIPIKTYHDLSASEEQEITSDLQEWMTNVSQADKSLKEASVTSPVENDDLPPIRSTTNNEVPSSKQQNDGEIKKKKPVLPRGYHEWDRFDPDKEIDVLEEKEKEARKKQQEKAKVMNENAVPSNLDLKGKSETEKEFLANREKEKGNEAFQSGNYSEALTYYCRSIDLNPKAIAVYNNRALAEIRLEKYQEAIDDCSKVLSAEPNNVKAYLRRSIAHKAQGLKEEATADLYSVLAIEPNNKRAKELLGEMKKNESNDKEPIKPTVLEDSRILKHDSTNNERTSPDIYNSVANEKGPSTTKKGKRLKIVEVEGENETETPENFNGESFVDEVNKTSDVEQQMESNDRTKDSECLSSAQQPQAEKEPDLPGLVLKAHEEGTQLFKLGRYTEAAEQFTQAVDILQKDKFTYRSALSSLLCNRGSCLMKIGDCAGCVADCTTALQLLPGDFRSLLKRAQAYETSEKYAKAWSDYQMALSVQSHHQAALQGNYRVSKHLESLYGPEWREKVSPPSSSARTESSASQTAVSSSLSHPTPVQAASGTLQSSDSGSAAATPPSPAEAVNGSTSSPTHPSPKASSSTSESQGAAGKSTVDPAVRFSQCKEKGNSLVKQNRHEEAVECYTECINIDPENVAVYTNRALCYLRLNQNELAIEDTTEALRLQPNNVKALFRRALAKKALCQYDAAARDLFELQKIEPKNAAAKKELDVVLELCRKERRESLEKNTKTKKKKKKSEKKTEQQKPQPNQADEVPKWRRITIKDVQNDDEDDEPPVPTLKEQSSSNRPPAKVPLNPTEESTRVKPVKLVKNTAYDFFQAWNSVKKGNTKDYADLLRQLETKRLAKVLSNKLDAPMLNNIIAALSQEIVPQGEGKLACDILEQLSHVERFDMVLLFMSAKEKNELQQLFSKLQAARSQESIVTSEEFDRLRTKYKI